MFIASPGASPPNRGEGKKRMPPLAPNALPIFTQPKPEELAAKPYGISYTLRQYTRQKSTSASGIFTIRSTSTEAIFDELWGQIYELLDHETFPSPDRHTYASAAVFKVGSRMVDGADLQPANIQKLSEVIVYRYGPVSRQEYEELILERKKQGVVVVHEGDTDESTNAGQSGDARKRPQTPHAPSPDYSSQTTQTMQAGQAPAFPQPLSISLSPRHNTHTAQSVAESGSDNASVPKQPKKGSDESVHERVCGAQKGWVQAVITVPIVLLPSIQDEVVRRVREYEQILQAGDGTQ